MQTEPQLRPNWKPIDSLAHPVRRRILRHFHSTDQAVGMSEVAGFLGLELSPVNYHLGVLASRGALQEAGRSTSDGRPLYVSVVADDPEILALLQAKKGEDESRSGS